MYCRYCREKIEDNATTCKSCGSNLIVEKTNKYKYCKYCYTKNQEDAKYCYKCSADLLDEVRTNNKFLSTIIGLLLSFVIYFVIYKVSKVVLSTADTVIFSLLALSICGWLDGIMSKNIQEKNNNHLAITGLLRDINHTFNPNVEIGNIHYDYEKDLKSTDRKIENKLFASKFFYHLRFLGKLAFVLFLFLLLHFEDKGNLIAILILFSIATNFII